MAMKRVWCVASAGVLGGVLLSCAGNSPPESQSAAGNAGNLSGGAGAGVGGAATVGGGAGAPTATGGVTDYTGGLPPLGGAAGTAPFDWVGVVGTGQSLAVGWEATAISTMQPFHNLKLEDDGPDPKYALDAPATAIWKAVPLVEPIRKTVPGYMDGPYPNNVWHNGDSYGESPHSGIGNMLSSIWQRRNGADYLTAHTVVGIGGVGIKDIAKSSNGYLAALNEARVFKKLATAAGKTYGVGAVVLTHGETDANNPDYGPAVFQLQQDYETDLKAATGQTSAIVMLASQQSSSAGPGNSAIQLWQQYVAHPQQLIVTGPKYQYGPYGLHMSAGSYLRMGEKYGEVFDLVVNQKQPWKPVGPNKISRDGAVIVIDFDVPNPPLNWDERLVAPHQMLHSAWSKGRGFEVIDAAQKELTIASVEIRDNRVVLTLEQAPAAGAALTVGYAVTQDTTDSAQGGKDLGPHGQLRDSDELIGADFEKIEVSVVSGSPAIHSEPNAFARRAPRDVVTGSGLPHDTVAILLNFDDMTLSNPWTGESGKATLTFNHDLHNYCVHFAMPVP